MADPRPTCGYRSDFFDPPLVCEREEGHTGAHIDFTTIPGLSVGIGYVRDPARLDALRQTQPDGDE